MVARIDSKELKRVITALRPFTVNYFSNKLMGFIHFKCKDNEIKFEALDGHRIGIEYLKCESDGDFSGYISPIKIGKVINSKCEIEMKEDKVYLDIDDIIYRFAQPQGEWYKIDDLINAESANETRIIGLNAKFLEDALKHNYLSESRDIIQLEVRGPKEPVIIRNCKNPKNIRLVLPVNI